MCVYIYIYSVYILYTIYKVFLIFLHIIYAMKGINNEGCLSLEDARYHVYHAGSKCHMFFMSDVVVVLLCGRLVNIFLEVERNKVM